MKIPYSEIYSQLRGARSYTDLLGADQCKLEQWALSQWAFADDGAIYLPSEERGKPNPAERSVYAS